MPSTYPPSRGALDFKAYRTRYFKIYVTHSNNPDLPFNQEVKTLKSGLNVTAEFIIMEYTEGERRITDVKRLDKQKMDDMVVSCVGKLYTIAVYVGH